MPNVATEAIPAVPAVPNADAADYVTKEEREERLWFLTERMLENVPRRQLIDMAMTCFGVKRRAAQKYVRAIERRLSRRAYQECPAYYLMLTRSERDKVAQELFARMRRPEQLDNKDLIEISMAINRVLDSRDRAANALFRMRDQDKTESVTWDVQQIKASRKMLRDQSLKGVSGLPEQEQTLVLPGAVHASETFSPPQRESLTSRQEEAELERELAEDAEPETGDPDRPPAHGPGSLATDVPKSITVNALGKEGAIANP